MVALLQELRKMLTGRAFGFLRQRKIKAKAGMTGEISTDFGKDKMPQWEDQKKKFLASPASRNQRDQFFV